MSGGYRNWSGPARALALAVDAAVSAARAGDAEAFDAAAAALARLDDTVLAEVLGAVLRLALEQELPDGLDADGAEQVLRSCVRASAGWYPALDTDALLRALLEGLGVAAADDAPALDPVAVRTSGLLLLADRPGTSGPGLAALLDAALAEVQRAQTMEQP